jgi:hypothetical protein
VDFNLHLTERKGLALERFDDRCQGVEFGSLDVNLF